tara:strand:+ start:220 stop:516 length:297 start_codon:yes stop_codon:yes gene_type:complete
MASISVFKILLIYILNKSTLSFICPLSHNSNSVITLNKGGAAAFRKFRASGATTLNVEIYVYMFKRVDISMMIICYDSIIVRHDRRTPELSNAALHMK